MVWEHIEVNPVVLVLVPIYYMFLASVSLQAMRVAFVTVSGLAFRNTYNVSDDIYRFVKPGKGVESSQRCWQIF